MLEEAAIPRRLMENRGCSSGELFKCVGKVMVCAVDRKRCVDGAGNIVTPTFLPLALIACMVGLASVFAGTNHLRIWRGDSLSSAASTSLTAWLLTLLAMGVACKEIHVGGMNRQKRLVSLSFSNHSIFNQFTTNTLVNSWITSPDGVDILCRKRWKRS